MDKNPFESTSNDIKVELENIFIDEKEKTELINRLPDDLLDEVSWQLKYAKEKYESFDVVKEVRGKIFELLVIAQYFPKDDLASEFTDLLQHPDAYNIVGLGAGDRNPDAVYVEIDTKTGDLIIDKVIDAKSGSLDIRAADQFVGGFRGTLNKIVNILNDKGKSKGNTLKLIPEFSGRIRIAADFKQGLVVPADRDINNLVNENSFRDKEDNLDTSYLNDFYEVLQDVDLKQSLFTNKDISNISEVVIDRMAG